MIFVQSRFWPMPRKGVVVSQERSHWRALFILAGVLRQTRADCRIVYRCNEPRWDGGRSCDL